ncbi:conserved hypothetical protein [Talaromyces stipitatus ATCC 10500]|uniref:DUF7702 domain-containing protein n=1 Tax=Talaromyces stipitatus (strain ATCC 10500 / CBS 375.48 / QM 6759 / NRRL 1006) TaxID=441959 RepID=B8LXX6_TALSN|nr:uncharacterized protein TSTA_062780 [Talaromyces stipitatus ATCC 10500]EED22791.1 conserved hypothetical protein [Talaromyces stipitatus ATCC 10500]
MLNEHSRLSIAQIVFYSPAVLAAIALLFLRKAIRALPLFPWIVLLIFTLVRLVGGIVVILYENDPSSTGLLIATLILLNIGVFPCIAATIGLINIITYVDFRENKILTKTIVCSRLLLLAGVALLVTGGSLQGDDSPDDQATGTKLVRIGYCIVTVFVACLFSFQLFFWSRRSQLSRTSFFVLRSASIAMPFFVVRLTYAFLSIYHQDQTWNSLTGPVVPFILMALLMEYCVVLIYLYTGFKVRFPEERAHESADRPIELKS